MYKPLGRVKSSMPSEHKLADAGDNGDDVDQARRDASQMSKYTEEEMMAMMQAHIDQSLAAIEECKRNPPPKVLDKTCLSYWFPILKTTGVPVPETEIIEIDFNLCEALENDSKGDSKMMDGVIARIETAADQVAARCGRPTLPFFLRTGQGSGKHDWNKTCFVLDKSQLKKHVYAIWEWSEMVDFIGLKTDVWAVREMLPTQPMFHAFWGDMPIVKERRYFIYKGRVYRHAPYWPPYSIQKPSTPNWEPMLQEMNHESPEEIEQLTALSEQVGKKFPEYWSVDWLWVEGMNKWHCTDMAAGSRSFSWTEYFEQTQQPVEHPNIL